MRVSREEERIFGNEEIKERIHDLDESINKKSGSGIKFRKKKTLPNTATKYSRSTAKNNSSSIR